jgi:hypothetical protein
VTAFWQSPLRRRPDLFGRKIAQRLGLYRENLSPPVAPVRRVDYPDLWHSSLRSWIASVPVQPTPYPFSRVFGQDLDETVLLDLCRHGPVRGERGLTGDIKLVWEYSRGYPLVTNALAGANHAAHGVDFLRRWTEAANDPNGPAWACAMEIAIRAVNWIVADVLLDQELSRRFGSAEWATALWRHGWLIWRRLEARFVSSNHYLADLLGLLAIGSVFPEDFQARCWARFALNEFPRALLSQTHSDGGLREASLRYHAYATEMALLFRLFQGSRFEAPVEARLHQMCQIVADFRDSTGDVYPIGDDDSGRVLALDAVSSLGRADILSRLASSILGRALGSRAEAVCPTSGWWVRRAGDFVAVLDFGGVGLHGNGGHAHNDDLAFCLDWRGRPVIGDPGTFVYTSDPLVRNRFRSTQSHSVLVVDRLEQRPLSKDIFSLPGPDRAFHFSQPAPERHRFSRSLPQGLEHRRELQFPGHGVVLEDTLEGAGTHHLEWRFLLHPSVRPRVTPRGFVLEAPDTGSLFLETGVSRLKFGIEPSEFSPAYGRREATRVCTAALDAPAPACVQWRVSLTAS